MTDQKQQLESIRKHLNDALTELAFLSSDGGESNSIAENPTANQGGAGRGDVASRHLTAPPASDHSGLPWKAAKYGEWVFANEKGAEELRAKLLDGKASYIAGGYEYKLNGKFINRQKAK